MDDEARALTLAVPARPLPFGGELTVDLATRVFPGLDRDDVHDSRAESARQLDERGQVDDAARAGLAAALGP